MLLWRKLRDVRSLPSDPARAALTPLLCSADSDLRAGGNCCEQTFLQGRVTTPLCAAALRTGVGLRGQLSCSQGTPRQQGSVVSWTPGREGQTPCPGSHMAVGEASFCLLPLWPEAMYKLSIHQPMRNSNNQCRPQTELRWSERPSCQTWSQRINLGVLRVVCYFQRSGVRGPFLGALGTSSHKDPNVTAASSAGECDPLTQSPGHGEWLSQHSLGPGSWKGERQTW